MVKTTIVTLGVVNAGCGSRVVSRLILDLPIVTPIKLPFENKAIVVGVTLSLAYDGQPKAAVTVLVRMVAVLSSVEIISIGLGGGISRIPSGGISIAKSRICFEPISGREPFDVPKEVLFTPKIYG